MTTTTNTKKVEKFTWNEENAAKVVELYEASENDNSQENLGEIAKAVGARSAKAVQSKLVSMKAYVKADEPRKVGGASSVRKAHYVREIAKALDIDSDVIESMEKANKGALAAILEAVGGDELESKD